MTTHLEFSDGQLHTIVHGLRVAAEQFDRDAKTCRDSPGTGPLADQFVKQAQDSRMLAAIIENGGPVTLAEKREELRNELKSSGSC